MRGLGFTLVVTLSSDESCDGDGGSIDLLYRNIGESGTVGGVCTKYTGANNISSIAKILASWIDLMFSNQTEGVDSS